MKNPISIELIAIGIWFISFAITYLAIPRIVDILHHIKLFDKPNKRSFHLLETPSMGGGAFYISFISSLFFCSLFFPLKFGIAIVFGISMMFFMGVKDDISIINPQSKILAQIIATLALLPFSEFQIISFPEFLFVADVSMWSSIIFSCILVFVIINSYNLIDGIDGFAGMLGIVILGIFSFLFYQINDKIFFIISLSSTAFLFAFLRFNLSKTQKIFMGDTGTMIVGFIIALLSLHLLALKPIQLQQLSIFNFQNRFLLLFAILFVPVFDFARVFFLRTIKKRNPFSADRNHLHHLLVDEFKLSHIMVSAILSGVNLGVFMLVYLLFV